MPHYAAPAMPPSSHDWRSVLGHMAAILGIWCMMAVPVSTAATNLLAGTCLLLVLAGGAYADKWRSLRHNPVALTALLMLAGMTAGTFYSLAPWPEALKFLDNYRVFLFVPLFVLIFRNQNYRQAALDAFLWMSLGILCLSYLNAFTPLLIAKGMSGNAIIFKNHITHSLLMVFAAYMLAVYAVHDHARRWLYGAGAALACIDVLFLVQSRSGYIMLFVLGLFWIWQVFRLRGVLLGGIGLGMLALLSYHTSANFQARWSAAFAEAASYWQHESAASKSTELRLEFFFTSFELVRESPWLGRGTGSFARAYTELAERKHIGVTHNPHNEYLLLAVQYGMVGVALFIALLALMWRLSTKLGPRLSRPVWLAQGLVVWMAAGCAVNSLLSDFTEGHWFAFMTGLLYAGLMDTPPQIPETPYQSGTEQT